MPHCLLMSSPSRPHVRPSSPDTRAAHPLLRISRATASRSGAAAINRAFSVQGLVSVGDAGDDPARWRGVQHVDADVALASDGSGFPMRVVGVARLVMVFSLVPPVTGR